jgi:hypothetical protein
VKRIVLLDHATAYVCKVLVLLYWLFDHHTSISMSEKGRAVVISEVVYDTALFARIKSTGGKIGGRVGIHICPNIFRQGGKAATP